jgi:outer membrane protein assembly factor BamB
MGGSEPKATRPAPVIGRVDHVTTGRRIAKILLSLLIVLGSTSFATGAVRVAAAPAALPAAGPGETWGQDGFGPGNTGYNPDTASLAVPDLRQRWSVSPATGVEGCGTTPGPPLVADGRVFFADDGGVGAYDAATGRNLWRNTGFRLLGPTLAVAGGLVLATESSCFSQSNFDGTVMALDGRTGGVRWRATQEGTIDFLVAEQGVIVTHGYCGVCGEHQNEIVALRASDGRRLWHRPDALLAGPVSAGGRVLLTVAGHAIAVDVATGATRWMAGDAWWARSATPDGDRFYATFGNDLAALDAGTGRVVWRVSGGAGEMAADGRRVFVAATGVTAYDAGSGRRLWSRAVANAGRPIRAAGLLWITTGGRPAVILQPITGRPAPVGSLFSTAQGHVVVAAGRVFTTDGTTIRAYAPSR